MHAFVFVPVILEGRSLESSYDMYRKSNNIFVFIMIIANLIALFCKQYQVDGATHTNNFALT